MTDAYGTLPARASSSVSVSPPVLMALTRSRMSAVDVSAVLPLVAVGTTWRWLYADDGMINQALEAVGAGFLTRAWLGDHDLALFALGLIGTWCMSGLCMVLFLSGAQRIDPALNEAAAIESTLQALAAMRKRSVEVIVADGGSTDATVALASPLADRLAARCEDRRQ